MHLDYMGGIDLVPAVSNQVIFNQLLLFIPTHNLQFVPFMLIYSMQQHCIHIQSPLGRNGCQEEEGEEQETLHFPPGGGYKKVYAVIFIY